jgi:hypothetical protein
MTRGEGTTSGGPTRRDLLVAGAAGRAGALLSAGAIVMAQADSGTAAEAAPSLQSAPTANARRAVSDVEPAIQRISREVWENAGRSRPEMKAHAIHIRELEAEGFRITSRNASGYPTAFIAEWTRGAGGPVIAYLPEYDALPGLGNAAEMRPTPGPTGIDVGHACGHNLIGAVCTGAAFARNRVLKKGRSHGLPDRKAGNSSAGAPCASWQAPSPLPQRPADPWPAGGPKPPASARPAPGGLFPPAGSGAGLSLCLDQPIYGEPSRTGGETQCVSCSRPERRRNCVVAMAGAIAPATAPR